jgi:predicted transcriptional regulator
MANVKTELINLLLGGSFTVYDICVRIEMGEQTVRRQIKRLEKVSCFKVIKNDKEYSLEIKNVRTGD